MAIIHLLIGVCIVLLLLLIVWLSYKIYLCTRQISQNPYPIRILPS